MAGKSMVDSAMDPMTIYSRPVISAGLRECVKVFKASLNLTIDGRMLNGAFVRSGQPCFAAPSTH